MALQMVRPGQLHDQALSWWWLPLSRLSVGLEGTVRHTSTESSWLPQNVTQLPDLHAWKGRPGGKLFALLRRSLENGPEALPGSSRHAIGAHHTPRPSTSRTLAKRHDWS